MGRFCIKRFQFATGEAWLCQRGEDQRYGTLGDVIDGKYSLVEFPDVEAARKFISENDICRGREALVCEVKENIHGISIVSV